MFRPPAKGFIAISSEELKRASGNLAELVGKIFPNAAGKGAFPWSFKQIPPTSRPMHLSARQSHLEYLTKVLGVRSPLTHQNKSAPSVPEPVLAVWVETLDHKSNTALLQKIIAAWGLDAQSVKIYETESLAERSEFGESQFALIFCDEPKTEVPPRCIFASHLGRLEGQTSLKKKLWERIKQARAQLNGSKVRS